MKSYVFPGNINEEILQIGAKQIPYMRTTEFSAVVKDCERMLLSMIGSNDGRTIIYTASGTGAMDAIVANYVASKGKAFVIAGGSFGYRWRDLCKYYDCPFYLYEVPFAKDMNYLDFEQKISEVKPEVLLCQHHETSSGQLFDIKKIAAICKKYNVSLVVDVISSFLADPFNMDELGVDICLTSTQKGLNIPPGLAIIFLSKRVLEETLFTHKGFYFDFEENLKNLVRGQTPYSPATTLFLQLYARLKQITEVGIDAVIEDVKAKAEYFRTLCVANNWSMPAQTPSNCITSFFVNNNGDKIFRALIENNIFVMPGSKEGFFRVSHLGIQSEADLDKLANYIMEIENS